MLRGVEDVVDRPRGRGAGRTVACLARTRGAARHGEADRGLAAAPVVPAGLTVAVGRRVASGRPPGGVARALPGGAPLEYNNRVSDPRADRLMADLRVETPLRAGGPNPVPIEELLAFQRCTGVGVAAIEGGEVAWERGYGVIAAGSSVAVTRATCFQCCSISKHVAMVGALRLVEEGRLDLDADVNRSLRGWWLPTGGATITARMLLGHTAGLTYCWYRGFGRGEPLPTRIDVLAGRPPANTPPVRVVHDQTSFRYSGSHYTVLEQLMVDLTEEPFPELMRRLVLDPLEMVDSSYAPAFPETRLDLTARGHHDDGEVVRGGWRVQPEMAGAGLWTTAGDLARLAVEIQRAHRGRGRLLSKRTIDQALTPGPNASWGLGTTLAGQGTDRRFGHGGDNVGFKAQTRAYLERGQGAVVLANGDDGARVIDIVVEAFAREYGWPADAP
jgi:CubicO group peptidase (beta-lactamase class C family)